MNENKATLGRLTSSLPHPRLRRGMAFGAILVTALLAFEIFNYSTTDYALRDLLGDFSFMEIRWATILALAFCGIDFAGIARLFTPEERTSGQNDVWYLFGAWLLAATMNAMLTWWGVSLAVLNHQMIGSAVIERATLLRVVPIFIAVLVWLIRVLIIGTFSVAGERMFGQEPVAHLLGADRPTTQMLPGERPAYRQPGRIPAPQPQPVRATPASGTATLSTQAQYSQPAAAIRPASRPPTQADPAPAKSDLTYVPVQLASSTHRVKQPVENGTTSTDNESNASRAKRISFK